MTLVPTDPAPPQKRLPGLAPPLGSLRELMLVFIGYLVAALLFHAIGVNLFENLLGGGDGFTAGYPSKLFAIHLSAWNPYVQLGQFSFANTQFQPFYPPALFFMAVFPNAFGYNLFILFHYGLAGLLFYLLAKNRGLSRYAAAAGGLFFMLSGFLSAHKGHQAMMSTAVWLPGMLLFIDRYVLSGRPRELASVGIVFAMSVLGGFPQVTVYSLLLVGAYTIFRFRAKNSWPATLRLSVLVLGAAGALAILLSSLQLFAVAEALPQMTREKLTYQTFSEDYFPPYHLLTFVIPNILGGFFRIPTYSPQIHVVEVYPYMGLLPIAIAIIAWRLGRRQSRDIPFWVGVVAVGLILIVGECTPLNAFLFHVPVYNLFRAPARHLLEIHLGISMLAAIGLDLALRPENAGTRRLRGALTSVSVVLLTVFAAVYALSQILRVRTNILSMMGLRAVDELVVNSFLAPGTAKRIIETNLAPSSPTLVYPCIFLVLSIMLLYMLGRSQKWVLVAIPLVAATDMYVPYSTLYGKPSTTSLSRPEARPETAFLKAQGFNPILYRLYPLDQAVGNTYPLLNMTYGWSTVNDYTPMWLKRYVGITDFALNGAAPLQNLSQPNALAAAGAQYLLTSSRETADLLSHVERLHARSFTPVTGATFVADHATLIGSGKYRLQSTDGTAVSMVLAYLSLQKGGLYRITFDSAAPEGITKPFLVNLYASDYDHAAQYKVYYQLSQASTHQTALINSGPEAPTRAALRLYTQSTTPVEIGNIRIAAAAPLAQPLPPETVYSLVYTGADGTRIFRNTLAQPRFRFVKTLRPCKDEGDARAVLEGDPGFDVASEALVEGIPARVSVAEGEILKREIRDSEMKFLLRTGERSFFIVADSWFPGWQATVDGKNTPIYPVNGFLRGVLLEGAGTHRLVMTYHPWSVPAGIIVTVVGLLLLIFLYRFEDRAARWVCAMRAG